MICNIEAFGLAHVAVAAISMAVSMAQAANSTGY